MYINKNGQLDYRSGDEKPAAKAGADRKPLIDPELRSKAAEFAKDVGGTAVKATAVGAGAAGAGIAVSAGGTTAATAIGAGIAATYIAASAVQDDGEKVTGTQLEDASGGVPYQQVMQENATAEIAKQAIQAQPEEEEIMDPFEAFRQCMGTAGLETATEIQTDTACLPQQQSRQNTMDISR